MRTGKGGGGKRVGKVVRSTEQEAAMVQETQAQCVYQRFSKKTKGEEEERGRKGVEHWQLSF